MKERPQKMPFGYEAPVDQRKGTLVLYDSFEHITEQELDQAARIAKERAFAKLVFYPLHEQTVRRMSKEPVSALYKREDRIYEWKREREDAAGLDIHVERLEAKRKKYTPLDSALRHLAEAYPGPLFLLVSGETANAFASYSSFEEWIVRIRLLIMDEPVKLHSQLVAYRNRWQMWDEQ
jgi:hypothetical protein